MDNKIVFTKTAKGVGEAVGKTRALSRDLRAVLKEVDGKASLDELLDKIGSLSEAKLRAALSKLSADDYIREFAAPTLEADTLDFSTILPSPPKSTRAPGQKTRINQALLMQLEARAQAEVATYERLEREQQERERLAEEEQALRKEEEQARRAAQQRAMKAAQESARQESEARAIQALEDEARRQEEEQTRRDAEEAAKRAAELQKNKEVEERRQQEAEEQARQAAIEKSRLEAAAKEQRDAEDEFRRAAEQQSKKEEEDRMRRQEEERARKEAEEQARLAAQQHAAKDALEQARRDAEEQARRNAEVEALRLAEEQARIELEEVRRTAEADAQARKETEEAARREAEEQAKQEAEERRRKLAVEHRAKRDAEVRAKKEAEERARLEAEEQARKNAEVEALRLAEEQTRIELEEVRHTAEAEAQARKEAEEAERRKAEKQTRYEAEEQARRDAEERARQDDEEKSRREAESLVDQNIDEAIHREFEELARQQAEEVAREKEKKARRNIEEVAQRKAGAKAKKDKEDQARRERERSEARHAAEVRAKQEVEQWQREAEQEKARKAGKKKSSPAPEPQADPDIDDATEQDEEERIEYVTREDEERDVHEAIEPDDEKTSFFGRREKTYRRPVKWGKPVAVTLLLSAVLGVGLIHVIAFDSQTALFEKAAAAQFQQPVKIGKVQLSLLPRPHWRLEDVSIGAQSQITAPRIKATTELGSLFSDNIALKSIELQSPVFNEQALEWLLFGRTQQRNFTVGRVSVTNAKLNSRNISLSPFSASADIGADGSWQKITVDSLDKKTVIQLRPASESVHFELSADAFEIPFGSTLTLDGFTAKGTARRNEIAITDFNGRFYDGIVGGTAKLQWGTSWSLKGDVHAKLIDASQFAPGLLQSGKLEGNATYALQAAHADKLFAEPRVEGLFAVQNGTLLGVDFAKLMRSTNSAGKSSFTELTGTFVQEDGKIQLQKVYVGAGLLTVKGKADMDAAENLSGQFTVELKSSMQQTRSNLVVAGTLKEPQFNR
ncbi:MAG: hypothetical protein A3I66_06255 [Burkholderiales bacterium RIFCSPLOWO2_02_FULL_57_36]|nr:MAG: hypothetical protein A3I66_06255 [Burkholderiales bacterium RIFCSPLOWO2_02_FULL_57_36]